MRDALDYDAPEKRGTGSTQTKGYSVYDMIQLLGVVSALGAVVPLLYSQCLMGFRSLRDAGSTLCSILRRCCTWAETRSSLLKPAFTYLNARLAKLEEDSLRTKRLRDGERCERDHLKSFRRETVQLGEKSSSEGSLTRSSSTTHKARQPTTTGTARIHSR
jgi:hypothetical protein